MFHTMFRPSVLWTQSGQLRTPGLTLLRRPASQRFYAVSRAGKSVSEAKPSSTTSSRDAVTRLFPKFMQKYAAQITSAPASHITAFLIVHELSAIVPLVAIWGGLWYTDYLPAELPDWVVERGTHFVKKLSEKNNWTILENAETGSRLILQGATAYAAVKLLLPVRLIFSLWAMPWAARWTVIPITSRFAAVGRRVIGLVSSKATRGKR